MKPTGLHIGTCDKFPFYLPEDAVTQTIAILAKRGMGKTFTAAVIVEEMIDHKHQVVVIDPLDSWYGLRSSRDGKSPGKDIVVIGGERGDLPLNPTDGEIIADFIVDNRANVVLSLRHMSNAGARTFVGAFLDRLYFRKGEGTNRTPLHLVIDEADEFCPQRLQPEHNRVFGAVDRIVRRGRSSGLGVTLISQRSAAVNKDCLTQTECLICLRTTSPQDRTAIKAWIEYHADTDKTDEFMRTLQELPVGTAWIWAPGWLGALRKVQIRYRTTFDSSATPKFGDKIVEPQKIAAVDIAALRAKLAATIEQNKADDPKALKARISALELSLRKKMTEPAVPAQPTLTRADVEKAFFMGCEWASTILKVETDEIIKKINFKKVPSHIILPAGTAKQQVKLAAPRVDYVPVHSKKMAPHEISGSKLGKCERAILTVLARYPEGRDRSQIALMSGYSGRSSGFANALSTLRTGNLITDGGGVTKITPNGADALGTYESLPPPGQELFNYWRDRSGKCEAAILQALNVHGGMDRNSLAAACEPMYSPTSSGYANALSTLRTLELIVGSGTQVIELSPLLR